MAGRESSRVRLKSDRTDDSLTPRVPRADRSGNGGSPRRARSGLERRRRPLVDRHGAERVVAAQSPGPPVHLRRARRRGRSGGRRRDCGDGDRSRTLEARGGRADHADPERRPGDRGGRPHRAGRARHDGARARGRGRRSVAGGRPAPGRGQRHRVRHPVDRADRRRAPRPADRVPRRLSGRGRASPRRGVLVPAHRAPARRVAAAPGRRLLAGAAPRPQREAGRACR